MGGAGTAAQPYFTQSYEWQLRVHDLELLSTSFDFDAFRFADRDVYVTHTSSNRAPFE
jgi:hypothetical protein